MNKLSLRVWFILAICFISFAVIGGDNIQAKITDPEYFNPTQSDDPTADVNSETDADASEQASADFGLWDYIKVLFSLAFVIGLLIFVLKFLNKKNIAYQQNNLMHNLGGVSVGPQKSVQLIKVGNRMLVVGVGDNVELLANIDNDEEVERLINLYDDQFNEPASKPYLLQLLSKNKEQKAVEQKPFGDLLHKRLSEIKKERSDELERWKDKESDRR